MVALPVVVAAPDFAVHDQCGPCCKPVGNQLLGQTSVENTDHFHGIERRFDVLELQFVGVEVVNDRAASRPLGTLHFDVLAGQDIAFEPKIDRGALEQRAPGAGGSELRLARDFHGLRVAGRTVPFEVQYRGGAELPFGEPRARLCGQEREKNRGVDPAVEVETKIARHLERVQSEAAVFVLDARAVQIPAAAAVP